MQDANPTHIKVLMTTDTVGGVWTYSLELCRALQPYGVQFHLVTTGAPMQQGQRADVEALANVQVYETDFKLEWMDDPWADIERSGAWLQELARSIQPDLVHLNAYSYGALHFDAPKLVVAHSDVYSWWWAVHGQLPPECWRTYYHHVRDGLCGADLILAPSQAVLRNILMVYAPAAPVRMVYNGRDNQVFRPAAKRPHAIGMGRIWDEAKNTRLLLHAAQHLPYGIRLAGDNAFAQQRTDVMAPNITYLGKLSEQEVAQELSTASVFVLPAKYEPFGLSALEAALSGCALVLGNIPSLREIWGDSAQYVDTDDAVGLAVTVNKLLSDDDVLQDYAYKAWQRAQQFSADKWATQYNQVYQQLVRRKTLIQQETA